MKEGEGRRGMEGTEGMERDGKEARAPRQSQGRNKGRVVLTWALVVDVLAARRDVDPPCDRQQVMSTGDR